METAQSPSKSRAAFSSLLPPRAARRPLVDQLRPRGPVHALSVAILWLVTAAYLATWVEGHADALFDTGLTHHDARMWLVPFHRYGPESALADDPISDDYLAQIPPAVRLAYRGLVPVVGVHVASKVVQAFALGLIAVAAWVLARSRRVGLGGGLLLLVLVLHTGPIAKLIFGGFARAFSIPVAALWVAGALAASPRTRAGAALLGAVAYPPAMLLVLGAEGLLAVAGLARLSPARVGRRLARVAALAAFCGVALAPYLVAKRTAGPPPTLEQARATGAFGTWHGRLKELPFPDPIHDFPTHALWVFQGAEDFGMVRAEDRAPSPAPLLWVGLFLALSFLRLAPSPRAALTLAGATLVLYAMARWLAFALFSPNRYYLMGMPLTSVALAVGAVGLLAPRMSVGRRAALRNAAATAVVGGLWVTAGDGIMPHLTLDARHDEELHAFVRTLPTDARIATHLFDGQGIPLHAARATTGNMDTVQPWATGVWERAERLTKETFTALYATRRDVVLDYCRRRGVTHLLLQEQRYRAGFRPKAQRDLSRNRIGGVASATYLLYEPFRTFVYELTRELEHDDLVLGPLARARGPHPAIVYDQSPWRLVEVSALERLWAGASIPDSVTAERADAIRSSEQASGAGDAGEGGLR